jgi:translation initiation factor IF-2
MRDQLTRASAIAGPGGVKHEVTLPSVMSVRDFAGKLGLPITRVIQQLMKAGILASQNERLDFMTAAIIAEELGYKATEEAKNAGEMQEVQEESRIKLSSKNKLDLLLVRQHCGMGHVDHGKQRHLMRFAKRMLWRANPEALPSISARIRLRIKGVNSRLLIRLVMKHLR